MEALILLLSCVAIVQAGPWESFASKYATVKIFSSCLGEDFMMRWHKNYSEAVEFCKVQNSQTYLEGIPADDYDHLNMFGGGGNGVQQDAISNYQQGFQAPYGAGPVLAPAGVLDLNTLLNALQGNLTNPVLLVPLPYLQAGYQHQNPAESYYRKKRDVSGPIYNEKKIKEIFKKIQAKAGNFTCVVKKLEIFNDMYDVNIQYLMDGIKGLNLDESLSNDLNEAITDCIRFAACRPLNKANLMAPSVQRAMTYLKCETKQRLAACVKNDVKKMQNQFDMEALHNVKAGSNVDDEDKMLAILWGEFKKD